jgi:hypothetical protein
MFCLFSLTVPKMCLLELANCDREFSETVDDVRYNLIKTRFVNFVISRERIVDTTMRGCLVPKKF